MSEASARLFVALELPSAVRTSLAGWGQERLHTIDGMRLVDPEAMHVTLCFLGSSPVQEIGRIASACEVVAGRGSIGLCFGEVLWLPHRRPRVVAVGLDNEDGRLASLQAKLSEALSDVGVYKPQDRPFLGHATVARLGRGAQVRGREVAAPEPARFWASTVTLFRSWLGRGPARYESLASVRLSRGDG